ETRLRLRLKGLLFVPNMNCLKSQHGASYLSRRGYAISPLDEVPAELFPLQDKMEGGQKEQSLFFIAGTGTSVRVEACPIAAVLTEHDAASCIGRRSRPHDGGTPIPARRPCATGRHGHGRKGTRRGCDPIKARHCNLGYRYAGPERDRGSASVAQVPATHET